MKRLLRRSLVIPLLLVWVLLSEALASATPTASPGDLDPSFGKGGMVLTNVTPDPYYDYTEYISALAVQPDGHIVSVGSSGSEVSYLALSRYLADGRLDPTFGSGGIVASLSYVEPIAVTLQPDGKILLVGYDYAASVGVLSRYASDGSLDQSFGSAGTVSLDFFPTRGIVQADRKIVVTGSTYDSAADFVAARVTATGQPDRSWGGTGEVITDLGGSDYSSGAAIQRDDKLLVGGDSGSAISPRFAMVRYLQDGSLDPTFGRGGVAVSSVAGYANDLVLQGDGKVVMGGSTAGNASDFLVARFQRDGSVDTSFGTGGEARAHFSSSISFGKAVGLEPDGKIVLAGQVVYPVETFGVARFLAGGGLDPTFGDAGKVRTRFTALGAIALATTVQPDGDILAGGEAWVKPYNSRFALARYLGS
jgi:uncharacterized delta-60 repeat protein